MSFGYERFQNRLFHLQHLRAEGFHVKSNGGLTIRQGGLIRVSLPDYHALQS